MKSYVVAAALFALLAVPAFAQSHDGSVELTLTTISGLTQTGQPDPAATPACWQKYHELLGQKVATYYQINTSTGMMIASSLVLGEKVLLHPLGIASRYAFMSDGVPPELEELGIFRVLFNLTLQLTDPQSTLLGKLDENNNCKISSGP